MALTISKYGLVFLLVGLLMMSCSEVKFESPQPQGVASLPTFPSYLRGAYVDEDNRDTLYVEENRFEYGQHEDKIHAEGELNDNNVFIATDSLYFLNYRDSLTTWSLMLIDPRELPKLTLSMFLTEDEKNVSEMKKILEMTETFDETGEPNGYRTNPTQAQFQELLQKRLYSQTMVFRKID